MGGGGEGSPNFGSEKIVELVCGKLPGGGGEGRDSLTRDQKGCAAGWGRTFTTGVTIMGSHFQ